MDNNISNNNANTNSDNVSEAESHVLNLKWIFTTFLATWPWFLVSVILAYLISFLYLRYTTPTFQLGSEILVEDSRTGTSVSGEAKILNELGYGQTGDNINNVMRSFRKNNLMKEVVNKLRLNVRYFEYGRFKTTEFYNNNPFILQIDDSVIASINREYSYVLVFNEDGTYKYKPKGEEKYRSGRLKEPVKLPFGVVVINKTGYPMHYGAEYEMTVTSSSVSADIFAERINFNRADKTDNSVQITAVDELPQRGIDVINTLVKVYMDANVTEKNVNAEKIINFIDDRIIAVERELGGVEDEIQEFKQRYNYIAPDIQSDMLYANTNENYKELSDLELRLDLIKSLEDYLRKSANQFEFIPTTLLTDNESLTSVLVEYNQLLAERDRKLVAYKEENPAIQSINKDLKSLRDLISNNLSVIKGGINLRINDIKQKTGAINQQINKVPEKDRLFIDKSRKQAIKQELYILLLTKREETAVTKAATTPNITIINDAVNFGTISPDSGKIKTRALVIGFLLPMIFFSVRRLLNNKIIAKSDIQSASDIPVLGEIGHYKEEESQVAVKRNSNTALSEQFRTLRTNLQFLLPNKTDKVILLTSSMSGEGKSFAAINLAITFAISGNKVALIEFDLRKPKISKHLGIDRTSGISGYAIGQYELDKIIIPSGIDDNLFVIPSGHIPPNPAELLMMPRIDEMFDKLKEQFDIIIVDTAPAGLVTDAILLNRFASTCLYIVRQGYTFKQQIQLANDLKRTGRIPKINFVINDVVHTRGYSYGYGYGYGYGYSYGYGYGYGEHGAGYYQTEKGALGKIADRFKKMVKK